MLYKILAATCIWGLYCAQRDAYAQELRAGIEASAVELDFANLTGGVGVRGMRLFNLPRGRVEAHVSYNYFHAVADRKPRVDVLAADAVIAAFQRAPIHPFVGLGAGVIRYDDTTVTSCAPDNCASDRFMADTQIFVRPTLLGISFDLLRRISVRAQAQVLMRGESGHNGTSKPAFFTLGVDYRMRR